MTSPAPTLATVWAHYDDDLIFANPTVEKALAGGLRVRSLFLTASDAGRGLSDDYVAEREAGIRGAYDVMLGASARWVERPLALGHGLTVTATAPEGDPRVELAFLRLPDGGLTGGGWFRTGYATLSKLLRGDIPTIRTLDTGLELTAEQLVATIAAFVAATGATAVLANLPGFADGADGDHPDHRSTGELVAAAVDAGILDGATVRYAAGYPSAERPENVDGPDLTRKLDVFAAYGAHDDVLRRDRASEYLDVPKFGEWLRRQYLVPDAEVIRPY